MASCCKEKASEVLLVWGVHTESSDGVSKIPLSWHNVPIANTSDKDNQLPGEILLHRARRAVSQLHQEWNAKLFLSLVVCHLYPEAHRLGKEGL